jgi:hypothetical protein
MGRSGERQNLRSGEAEKLSDNNNDKSKSLREKSLEKKNREGSHRARPWH